MFNGLLETTKRKAEELAKESKSKVIKTYEETSSSVKKKLANKEVSITLAQLKELKSGEVGVRDIRQWVKISIKRRGIA